MREQTKTEIDVLKQDWENRIGEIMYHSRRYHSQTNLVYLYLSAVVSLAALSFTDQGKNLFQSLTADQIKILLGVVLFSLAVIQFYIASLILESLSIIYANGGRIRAIEGEINHRLGTPLLKWETEIVSTMHDVRFGLYKSWINPNYIVSLWAGLIWLISAAGLVLAWKQLVVYYFPWFFAFVAIAAFFHIYQWIMLHTVGIEFIRKLNEGASLSDAAPRSRTSNFKIVVAILTLVLGIIPFAILSLATQSFWLNSRYDFPLLAIPSVWLGDTFVLPFFNYFVVDAVAPIWRAWQRKKLLNIWALSLALSFVLNSLTHYIWVHDQYSGFMDLTYATLSAAGWWHYGFSVLQTGIVFSIVITWYQQVRGAKPEIVKRFENAWKIFILFTAISILDFLMKYRWVYATAVTPAAFVNNIGAFGTLILSVATFIFMRRMRGRKVRRE